MKLRVPASDGNRAAVTRARRAEGRADADAHDRTRPRGTPGSPAQSAAVTSIPGVVFSGSLDGHLRAFASEDGHVLWDFDTVREYDAVNGGKGFGGSLDGPGPVVVDGMVFVNSGYSRFGGMPGNVLIALAPSAVSSDGRADPRRR